VGFSSHIIPAAWLPLYSINPVVGIIEGFRWALLGKGYPFDVSSFAISICLTVALFILGLNFFMKNERRFADII
jgi:lipopolysaccharide transport system permease protein